VRYERYVGGRWEGKWRYFKIVKDCRLDGYRKDSAKYIALPPVRAVSSRSCYTTTAGSNIKCTGWEYH
jgi:hypothetical protein